MFNLKETNVMTATELNEAQRRINEKIVQRAKDYHLLTDDIWPIYDGINDVCKYLSSSPRIMWILKEPYDDITKDGMPIGGDFNLYSCFDKDDAWKNKTWQSMTYVTYGIYNKCKYNDMDWIRNEKKMVDILKQIAYINVSKMPGYTKSDYNCIKKKYEIWKPILLEQISIYNPNIIIFGNTFNFFKSDLVGDDSEPIKKDDTLYVYEKNEVRYIDTYHPLQTKIKRELYVNRIIESCIS